MKLWHCHVCGCDWTGRGTEPPLRCGKCKSPYWDREKIAPSEYLTGPESPMIFPESFIEAKKTILSRQNQQTRGLNPAVATKQKLPDYVLNERQPWPEWLENINPNSVIRFRELRGRLPENKAEWMEYLRRGK